MTTKKLQVAFRMYGKGDPKGFISQLRGELVIPGVNIKFLMMTNPGDPLSEIAANAGAEVIYGDLRLFDKPVNAIYCHDVSNMLFISPGIELKGNQLHEAFGFMCENRNVAVYGWQVGGMGNDGSGPGLLWYNTCALIRGSARKHMADVPVFVNNGVLADLEIGGQKGPAGGGEETLQSLNLFKTSPKATVVVDISRGALPFNGVTTPGTGSTEWKALRKGPMGQQYLKLMGVDFNDYMKHVIVIK